MTRLHKASKEISHAWKMKVKCNESDRCNEKKEEIQNNTPRRVFFQIKMKQ
jgi:hypothetical protein